MAVFPTPAYKSFPTPTKVSRGSASVPKPLSSGKWKPVRPANDKLVRNKSEVRIT